MSVKRTPTREMDTILDALADPTRRHVVEMLRRGPRRAGELAAAAGTSAPAMSRHLRVLRTTGVVEAEGVDADARLRLYRLRPEPFAALRAWLDQVEAFWDEQLGAFKAFARDADRRTRGSSARPIEHRRSG